MFNQALVVASVFVFLGAVKPAACQGIATIRGEVTDPSEKSIPDAVITLGNEGRISRSTKTDLHGEYVLGGIPPGTYTVSVSAQGFAPVKKAGYEVAAGAPQILDFALAL